MCVCVCVCLCVEREREREGGGRERESGRVFRKRGMLRGRESVCREVCCVRVWEGRRISNVSVM